MRYFILHVLSVFCLTLFSCFLLCFCRYAHCAFGKTPCLIARSLSFRVELCNACGGCVLSCSVAATTFLPDVFAVQRHIRTDGVFRRNKYLLRYFILRVLSVFCLTLFSCFLLCFCRYAHCAFGKTPCLIARSLSFRVELCNACGGCVLSCSVAATTFLPDVFAVQRHIRTDGVFRRNKYLLRYTYLLSRARLSLDNRGVLW